MFKNLPTKRYIKHFHNLVENATVFEKCFIRRVSSYLSELFMRVVCCKMARGRAEMSEPYGTLWIFIKKSARAMRSRLSHRMSRQSRAALDGAGYRRRR